MRWCCFAKGWRKLCGLDMSDFDKSMVPLFVIIKDLLSSIYSDPHQLLAPSHPICSYHPPPSPLFQSSRHLFPSISNTTLHMAYLLLMDSTRKQTKVILSWS
jgi:hypothetical protein